MMLHRHFEADKKANENITKLEDVTPKAKFVSEIFPPEEKVEEAPKKRSRAKKTEQ